MCCNCFDRLFDSDTRMRRRHGQAIGRRSRELDTVTHSDGVRAAGGEMPHKRERPWEFWGRPCRDRTRTSLPLPELDKPTRVSKLEPCLPNQVASVPPRPRLTGPACVSIHDRLGHSSCPSRGYVCGTWADATRLPATSSLGIGVRDPLLGRMSALMPEMEADCAAVPANALSYNSSLWAVCIGPAVAYSHLGGAGRPYDLPGPSSASSAAFPIQ
ncbi:hypothetical protein OH76DRAFT_1423497 [Lentinus brumalis]|uniref:Uncharacterized protein n=1 Tax=Lentinus brumalis TaxID=2498619 RepID=A0A371CKH7_9APHY|nr:hypothetical protein OH76DRAFT_1423497 [Polyporus brumalis]